MLYRDYNSANIRSPIKSISRMGCHKDFERCSAGFPSQVLSEASCVFGKIEGCLL